MRKLLVLLLAVALVVAFTVPAMAAEKERLKLSGTMRVRAWDMNNYDDWDSDNKADEESYWDQRFRLAATINAAEGVSGHLRFDFAEDDWGSDNWGGSRYDETSELQVDRAYLQVDKGMFKVKAGQLYQGLGNSIVVDQNATGVTVDLKLPVKLTLMYAKFSENGANTDVDATDDTDFYALNAGFKAGSLALDVFYASLDNKATEDSKNVMGARAKGAMGPVNLNVELGLFGGSNDTTSIDYIGQQLYGNVEMAAAENLKVGADIFYATGTEDANEDQLTELSDFGSFVKADRGAFETDIGPLPRNEFDPGGEDGGVTGFGIYANYTATESLLLQAHVGYFTPQEDVDLDNVTVFNLTATYTLAPGTTLAAGYNQTAPDADGNPDSASLMAMRFQIAF
jgi:hypothetical protein